MLFAFLMKSGPACYSKYSCF